MNGQVILINEIRMKKQFRPGSIVQLKSGSSDMIVIKYEMQPHAVNGIAAPRIQQPLVCVTWYESGKWKTGRFDPDLLVSVK